MEKTEPESNAKENSTSQEEAKLPWFAKLLKGLLFGICALGITSLFEHLSSKEDITALKEYQTKITDNLNSLRPLQLYNLYVAALGYQDVAAWQRSDNYLKAVQHCETVADDALRNNLAVHPGTGVAVETENRRYYCKAIATPQIVSPALDPLDKVLSAQGGPVAPTCLPAETEARIVGAGCLKNIVRPAAWADQWSSWVRTTGWGKIPPVQFAAWAAIPLTALGDVIWHNFLNTSSVALLHWLLLALGLYSSFQILKKLNSSEDNSFFGILFNVAAFPLLTVFFASVAAEFFYFLAQGGLWLFKGVTQIALYPLAGTTTYAGIHFFYSATMKSGEHAATRKAEHSLDGLFKKLFIKKER